MAKVIQNFTDDVLELIGTGEEFHQFDPNLGHFVRVTIRENSQTLGVYSSHRTWDGRLVYYDNHIPYDFITKQPLEDPYNEIQVPIYYDSVDQNGFPTENSHLYVKTNDIMEKDISQNYGNGRYSVEFDFLDDIFNHFVDGGLDYYCNIPGFCSAGGHQTQDLCESHGICLTGNGNCSYNTSATGGTGFGSIDSCETFGSCISELGTCQITAGPITPEPFVTSEDNCSVYSTGDIGMCVDSDLNVIDNGTDVETCCGANNQNCGEGLNNFYLITTSWTADTHYEDVTHDACNISYECASDNGDGSGFNNQCNSGNIGSECALEYYCDGDENFNVDCNIDNVGESCADGGGTCSQRGTIPEYSYFCDGDSGGEVTCSETNIDVPCGETLSGVCSQEIINTYSGNCIENNHGNNWNAYVWTPEQILNVVNADCQGPSPQWNPYTWTNPYESEIYYSTADYGGSDAQTTCDAHCTQIPSGGDPVYCEEIVNDVPFQLKYNNPRFWVKEVSPTGNEVRLLAVHDYWDGESYDELNLPLIETNKDLNFYDFQLDDNGNPLPTFLDEFKSKFGDPNPPGNETPSYKADLNLWFQGRASIPITNYVFDKVSYDTTSLIVRLQSSTSIPKLSNVELVKEIYPTQVQEIVFFADVYEQEIPEYLTPSEDTWEKENTFVDSSESYNDLIESASLTHINKNDLLSGVFSGSYTDDLTIDFSKPENSTFFGTQEYKIINFYNKIKKIEDYVNIISSSINVTSSIVNETKKYNFNLIKDEISKFTPYEKWLYSNAESTSSYPKAGADYSKLPAVTGSFSDNYKTIEGNASILKNQEGLDLIYKIESHGDDVIVSGSFTNASSCSKAWFTGSDAEQLWKFTGTKLAYDSDHGSGRDFVHQIFDNNTSLNQPDLAQFSVDNSDPDNPKSNTYIVEFDIADLHRSGRITFELGRNESENTFNRLDFDSSLNSEITANQHYKGLVSVEHQPDPNTNYLRIFAGEDSQTGNIFSGSIDNLEVRLAKDRDGKSDIFTDKYFVDDYSMANYNGEFYLSFLARWQSLPIWENTNISESNNLRPIIPETAFNSRYIESPTPTTESFQRYILAASQSFWKPLNINGQPGLSVNQATDSTYWEIQSGSAQFKTGSKLEGFDDLTPYLAYGDGTVLPTGELFRLYHITSSEEFAPVTSSFITDVKVFREDEIYNKAYSATTSSVSDVIWFTNLYSTSSQLVQDWYEDSLEKARNYDRNNIHSLVNNVPEFFIEEDTSSNLKLFLSLLAENYDNIKYYIDNYSNFNEKSYEDVNGVPNNVLKLIGDNYGWDFINPNQLKNLLNYYIGEETSNISYKDLTFKIWKNILNNLMYIYKSKGTDKAVRALINAFGLPPDIINVGETGLSSEQQVQSSPGIIPLTSKIGIRNYPGNISFNEKKNTHQVFNWIEPSLISGNKTRSLISDWNTSKTGLSQAVEFVFSSKSGSSTEYLIRSKASSSAVLNHPEISDFKDLWSLNLIPSQSSTTTASLMLQINSFKTGSNFITGSSISMSTDYLPIRYNPEEDTRYWNVLVQRAETGSTHIYELHIANRVDDTIKHIWSGSMTASATDYMSPTLSGSYVRENFVGTGSIDATSGSNLIIGPWHGSLGEFRVWKEPITGSDFLMHTFNWNSVVNRKSTNDLHGFEKLTYRYNFKGDYSSRSETPVIQDIVNNDKGSFSISLPASGFFWSAIPRTSFTKIKTTDFIFNVRNVNNNHQINTNKSLLVDETKNLKPGGLNSNESNLINIGFEDDYKTKQRFTEKVVKINISANTKINELFNEYLSDIDGGTLLANINDYDEEYKDLKLLKQKIVNLQNRDFLDINEYYNKVNKLIPPTFWDILSSTLPVGTDIEKSFVYENTILDRNKTALERDPTLSVRDSFKSNVNQNYFEVTKNVTDEEINFDNSEFKVTPITSETSEDLLDLNPSSELKQIHTSNIDGMINDENFSSTNLLNNYSATIPGTQDILNDTADFNQILDTNLEIEHQMDSSEALSNISTELTLEDSYSLEASSQEVVSSTIVGSDDWKYDMSNSDFMQTYVSDVLSKGDIVFVDTKTDLKNTISSELNLTEELNTETTGEMLNPHISQEVTISDDVSITANSNNPYSNQDFSLSEDNVNISNSSFNEVFLSTLDTISETLNTEGTTNVNVVPTADAISTSDTYDINSSVNENNHVVDNSISYSDTTEFSAQTGNSYVNDDVLSTSETTEISSEMSNTNITDESISYSDTTEFSAQVQDSNISSDSISFSETYDVSNSSFQNTILAENTLSPTDEAYIPSGEFQVQPQGSTGDINESIDDVFGGTNFDFTDFLDPSNTDSQIWRAISVIDGQIISGSNSLSGDQISYTIGDTERVWTRERIKRQMTIKYEGGIRIENIEDFVEREWDPTNPLNFTHQQYKLDGTAIGRTTQIRTYDYWYGGSGIWGDNDFSWGAPFGTIGYPLNHYIHTANTEFVDHLDRGTLNDGSDPNQTDPSNRTPSENKKGAIWVTTVDDGKSGTRIKVVKDN